METFIAALKLRNLKLPKFLLWKIAAHAGLEFDYSLELAKYRHGADTFKAALIRGKKMAQRMAKSMSDKELQVHDQLILKFGSAPLILRISDYLVMRHNYAVFEHVAVAGNISLLRDLIKKHYSNATPKFSLGITKELFERKMVNMLEYLLNTNSLGFRSFTTFNFTDSGFESPESVIKPIVLGLSKHEKEDLLQATEDCPYLAFILRKYL